MTPVIKVNGTAELKRALDYFRIETGKSASNGVRLASAFVAKALAARTRVPKGRGAYPTIRRASEEDGELLAPHFPNNTDWSDGRFRGYIKHWLAPRSYVAIADHPMPHGLPYRSINLYFMASEAKKMAKKGKNTTRRTYTVGQLHKVLRYRNAGLAKKVWTWVEKGAKGKSNSTALNGLAVTVHRDGTRPSVTISNRLSYAYQALESSNAIGDALHAASERMRGYVKHQLARTADRGRMGRFMRREEF